MKQMFVRIAESIDITIFIIYIFIFLFFYDVTFHRKIKKFMKIK